MWCRHCQQETPALGPATAQGPRCARCSRTSPQAYESPAIEIAEDPDDHDSARREIYRRLRSAHATLSAGESASTLRFDLAQTGLTFSAAPSPKLRTAAPTTRVAPARGVSSAGQAMAWLTAAFGAALLGAGIGLAAWSLMGDRPAMWNPGLITAICGQGIVILGLLQLLSSLWSAGRAASVQLGQMHGELRQMRRVQEEAAGRHAASAANFYSDLARDAGPEVLMGNLQGQVDRLAARLRASE